MNPAGGEILPAGKESEMIRNRNVMATSRYGDAMWPNNLYR
jgi:hypothetical protein